MLALYKTLKGKKMSGKFNPNNFDGVVSIGVQVSKEGVTQQVGDVVNAVNQAVKDAQIKISNFEIDKKAIKKEIDKLAPKLIGTLHLETDKAKRTEKADAMRNDVLKARKEYSEARKMDSTPKSQRPPQLAPFLQANGFSGIDAWINSAAQKYVDKVNEYMKSGASHYYSKDKTNVPESAIINAYNATSQDGYVTPKGFIKNIEASGSKFIELNNSLSEIDNSISELNELIRRETSNATTSGKGKLGKTLKHMSSLNSRSIPEDRRESLSYGSSESGEYIEAVVGDRKNGITRDLINSVYSDALSTIDDINTQIHSHPTVTATFSHDDISTALSNLDDGITNQIVASIGEVATLDLNAENYGISQQELKDRLENISEEFSKQFEDYFQIQPNGTFKKNFTEEMGEYVERAEEYIANTIGGDLEGMGDFNLDFESAQMLQRHMLKSLFDKYGLGNAFKITDIRAIGEDYSLDDIRDSARNSVDYVGGSGIASASNEVTKLKDEVDSAREHVASLEQEMNLLYEHSVNEDEYAKLKEELKSSEENARELNEQLEKVSEFIPAPLGLTSENARLQDMIQLVKELMKYRFSWDSPIPYTPEELKSILNLFQEIKAIATPHTNNNGLLGFDAGELLSNGESVEGAFKNAFGGTLLSKDEMREMSGEDLEEILGRQLHTLSNIADYNDSYDELFQEMAMRIKAAMVSAIRDQIESSPEELYDIFERFRSELSYVLNDDTMTSFEGILDAKKLEKDIESLTPKDRINIIKDYKSNRKALDKKQEKYEEMDDVGEYGKEFENLEKGIEELKPKVESFEDNWSEFLVTFKNGGKTIGYTVDELDDLKVTLKDISDIKFVTSIGSEGKAYLEDMDYPSADEYENKRRNDNPVHLKKDNSKLTSELESATNQLHDAESSLNEIEEELYATKAKHRELKKESYELIEKEASAVKALSDAESERDKALRESEELQDKLNKSMEENAKLESKAGFYDEMWSKANRELVRTEEELSNAQDEKNEALSKSFELEDKLAKSTEENIALQNQMTEAQENNAKTTEENIRLQEELAKSKEKVVKIDEAQTQSIEGQSTEPISESSVEKQYGKIEIDTSDLSKESTQQKVLDAISKIKTVGGSRSTRTTSGEPSSKEAIEKVVVAQEKLNEAKEETIELAKEEARAEREPLESSAMRELRRDLGEIMLPDRIEASFDELISDLSRIKPESAGMQDLLNDLRSVTLDELISDLGEVQTKVEKIKKSPDISGRKNKAASRLDNLEYNIKEFGNDVPDRSIPSESIEEARNGIIRLLSNVNDLKSSLDSIKDENGLDSLSEKTKILEREFAKLSNSDQFKASLKTSSIALSDKITKYINDTPHMRDADRAALESYIQTLTSGSIKSKNELNKIKQGFYDIQLGTKQAGLEATNFFDKIKQQASHLWAQGFAQLFGFYDIIRYIKQVASAVTEIDTAMTELKKVSNESLAEVNKSFSDMADSAKELGSTVSAMINATADWSRQGYNLPDAKNLAEISTLFANVGDGIDVSEANESLISTLKGFQLNAEDAITIVDKFNEVANNFAIDVPGIGEALQRSAASFNAANTDLSQSIALITTTNAVVQNPESVGTLWKTLSARIRGAKTELDDLSEEQDAYTLSTSKLQKLVKDLTGFDIMKDRDTFKSIYDIILGIGKEWDKLTDVQQASLGEALAGKRNANALYAIFNNIEDLESAYATAENSAGSAMREQEKYAQSVQYSIDRMKAAFEEFANELMDSSVVKGFYDAITNIIELVESIDLSGIVNGLSLGTTVLVGYNMLNGSLAESIEKLLIKNALSEQELALASQGGGVLTYNNALRLKQNALIATETALQGANTASIWAATKAWTKYALAKLGAFLISPAGILIAAGALGVLITNLIKAGDAEERAAKKHEEYAKALEESTSKINEFAQAQKNLESTVNSNIDEFAELSKGINQFGENVSLTDAEYDRFVEISKDLLAQHSDLPTIFDDEGNALVVLGNNAGYAANELRAIVEAQREIAHNNINSSLEDAFDTSLSDEEVYDDLIESYRSKILANERYISDIRREAMQDSQDEETRKYYKWLEENYVKYNEEYYNKIESETKKKSKVWNPYESMIRNWALTGEEYSNLDDSSKGYVQAILNSLNLDDAQIKQAIAGSGEYTEDAIKEYIQKYIINPFEDEDVSSSIIDAMSEVSNLGTAFSNGEITLEEYNKQLSITCALLNGITDSEGIQRFIASLTTTDPELEKAIMRFGGVFGSWAKRLTSDQLALVKTDEFAEEYDALSNSVDGLVISYQDLDAILESVSNKTSSSNSSSKWTEIESKAIDTYQSGISKIAEVLQKLQNGTALTTSEIVDLKQEFPELQNLTDINASALLAFAETLKGDVTSSVSGFSEEANKLYDDMLRSATGVTTLAESFDRIKSTYDAKYAFEKAVKNGSLTESELNTIAGLSENMKNLVAQYYSGAVSVEELGEALNELYDTDLKNYSLYVFQKNDLDTEFYNNAVENNAELIDAFADAYGVDLKNCKTWAEAKKTLMTGMITQLNAMMAMTTGGGGISTSGIARYYDVETNKRTSLYDELVAGSRGGSKDANAMLQVITALESAYSGFGLPEFDEATFEKTAKKFKDASNDTKNTIDWCAQSIENLNHALSLLDKELESTSKFESKAKILESILTLQNRIVSAEVKSSKVYEDEYIKKASKISDAYKKRIESNDTFSIEEFANDSKMYEYVTNAQSAWKTWQDAIASEKEAIATLKNYATQLADIPWDKAQAKIEKLNKSNEILSAELSNANGYKEKNKILREQLKIQEKIVDSEKAAVESTAAQLDTAKTQASSLGFSEKQLASIEKNRLISTNKLTGEALEFATRWNALITEQRENTKQLAIDEANLENQRIESIKNQLANITSSYDNKKLHNQQKRTMLESAMSLAEANGEALGKAYYESLIKTNSRELDILQSEFEKYQKKAGELEIGSDAWYEAQSTLLGLKNSMDELTLSTANYNNSLKELEWSRFDKLKDSISELADEMTFLASLFDENDLFMTAEELKESGATLTDRYSALTSEGMGKMYSHASNYNTQIELTKRLSEEIARLDAEYANDSMNSKYLERRKELVSLQRESINASQGEKSAIIEMVKNGLSLEQDALQLIVNERKEALSLEKEAYEFKKKTTEQSKNILRIEKQIAALEGDDSDENRKKLRELKESLKDAKDTLEDTMYEKSVSDQQTDLDNMIKDSQKAMDNYLSDGERVFTDALTKIQAEGVGCISTLESTAKSLGYTISDNLAGALDSAALAFGNSSMTFDIVSASIVTSIDAMAEAWGRYYAAADSASQLTSTGIGVDISNIKSGGYSYGQYDKIREFLDKNGRTPQHEKSYYLGLNQHLYEKYGKVLTKSAELELGALLGVDVSGGLNAKLREEILKKLKAAGFSRGGIIEATGEDGVALVKHGEAILTRSQTEMFQKFTDIMPKIMPVIKNPILTTGTSVGANVTYQIDNSITVDGVATDELVGQMANIAKTQSEAVIKKINSSAYALGTRR